MFGALLIEDVQPNTNIAIQAYVRTLITCYSLLITFLRGSTSAYDMHVAHALRAIK